MSGENGVKYLVKPTPKIVCVLCAWILRTRTVRIEKTEADLVVLVCQNASCSRFGLVTMACGEAENCPVCPPKAPGYVVHPNTKSLIKCPSCNWD